MYKGYRRDVQGISYGATPSRYRRNTGAIPWSPARFRLAAPGFPGAARPASPKLKGLPTVVAFEFSARPITKSALYNAERACDSVARLMNRGIINRALAASIITVDRKSTRLNS